MSSTYKVLDLFGNEEIKIIDKQKSKPNLFENYDEFIDKFEAKKTTDDCYTPKEVYDLVLKYVGENYDLEASKIIRPFYPGGDYESIEYLSDYVVIDNPPFSIISKICRNYLNQNIPFFLFAPHLTLFSSDIDVTHIVVGADITYENGAVVKTSFLTNMFGDKKIIGNSELYITLQAINDSKKVNLPKYEYPKNIFTVSQVHALVTRGISIEIDKNNVKHCRGLDSQKNHKKAIFGSGFLLSEKAAAEKAAAEKDNVIIWELSQKEIEIIKKLG